MTSIHIHNSEHSASFPQPSTSSGAQQPTSANSSHSKIAPGEIAIGVVIGRASEYFDFFVYAIASVLVFPSVFFPFEKPLEAAARPRAR